MRTPHIACYTTDNDIPSHTLPLPFFLRSLSLERLHIAKTLNHLTHPVLSSPPGSIRTLRLPFYPSSHGHPPPRITRLPSPSLPAATPRSRFRPLPRWPRHTYRKQGHHTHLSPTRGRRNHVRRPPQQSLLFHDRPPPSPITTLPPLPLGSATTGLILPFQNQHYHLRSPVSPPSLTSLTLSLSSYSFLLPPLFLYSSEKEFPTGFRDSIDDANTAIPENKIQFSGDTLNELYRAQ